MVQRGADVNAQDDRGQTAVHDAAASGFVQMVATLVPLGADVNMQTVDGWRPLHFAAHNGKSEVMFSMVKDLGLNIQAMPAYIAARAHIAEIVTLLLEAGADVHAITSHGDTALHLADTAAIVTLLLEAGADLHRRNHSGNTPLFQAIVHKHVKAMPALVQAGACPESSDGEWWTSLLVGAVTGNEAALTELTAASEELTRRMNENGHFARTAMQLAELAELSSQSRREQGVLIAALTTPQP